MKKSLFFLLISALAWASCKNDKTAGVQEIKGGGPNSDLVRNPATADMPTDTNQLARITYSETEYDFGTVNEGEVIEHKFQFTNTGTVPLTILNCRSSCGCTVPEWPEEPIPPGGTGEIRAKFNTDMKTKEQKKLIRVTANTYPNETSLVLKGYVNPMKSE